MKKQSFILLFGLTFLLLFTSCQNELSRRLDRLALWETTALKLEKQQALLWWYYFTENRPMQLAESFAIHPEFTSPDSIRFASETLAMITENKSQQAALRPLVRYLEQTYFRSRAVADYDRIRQLNDSKFVVPGIGEVQFGEIGRLLPTLNPAKQQAVLKAAYPNSVAMVAIRNHMRTELADAAEQLGFIDLNAAMDSLYFAGGTPDITPNRWIVQTQTAYDSLFRELFWNENTQNFTATIEDLLQVIQHPGISRVLNAQQMLSSGENLLRGLGIRLNRQSGLTVDTLENRNFSGKTVAIEIPSDIRMVVSPNAGLLSYVEYYQSLGSVESVLMNQEQNAISRYIRNPWQQSLSGIFEQLLQSPVWLAANFDSSEIATNQLRSTATFWAFWRSRSLAIALELTEISDPNSQIDNFANRLQTVMHFSADREACAWLLALQPSFPELESGFYQAILAPQMCRNLQQEFSVQWFENIEAGKMLKDFWAKGSQLQFSDLPH